MADEMDAFDWSFLSKQQVRAMPCGHCGRPVWALDSPALCTPCYVAAWAATAPPPKRNPLSRLVGGIKQFWRTVLLGYRLVTNPDEFLEYAKLLRNCVGIKETGDD